MTPRVRAVIAAVSCLGLLAVLVHAFAHLPPFGVYLGPYGDVLNNVAPHERLIPNIISAVNFDYRGLDTMGEEFILFAAVAGIALVLRKDRREITDAALPPTPGRGRAARTDAVRAFSILGIGTTIAFGVYLGLHPHLTPGGGFQGGAITAGFAALLFLGLGFRPFMKFAGKEVVEPLEALGAAGYAGVGVVTLILGGSFLANILPLGESGALFSTGTIPLINFFVALEVLAGFILMFAEFANETRMQKPPQKDLPAP